jgi:hypothetical protein
MRSGLLPRGRPYRLRKCAWVRSDAAFIARKLRSTLRLFELAQTIDCALDKIYALANR